MLFNMVTRGLIYPYRELSVITEANRLLLSASEVLFIVPH